MTLKELEIMLHGEELQEPENVYSDGQKECLKKFLEYFREQEFIDTQWASEYIDECYAQVCAKRITFRDMDEFIEVLKGDGKNFIGLRSEEADDEDEDQKWDEIKNVVVMVGVYGTD